MISESNWVTVPKDLMETGARLRPKPEESRCIVFVFLYFLVREEVHQLTFGQW